MDLPSPRELKLDSATRELLRDVEETARRVNDLRPLEPAVVKNVLDGLLADRVYSSNAVEGNPLGLGETREILQAGYVETGKSRAVAEVVNLGKAIAYVAENLQSAKNPYQLDELLRLHGVLMAGMEDKQPGRLRNVGVQIRGARHQPPDAADVADLLKQMFIGLRTETDTNPVVRAAWAHWAIARVHPFMDGNGRAARLWQDLILFRERYTCAIIPPHLRNQYLSALAAADEGNFNELIQQTARLVAETFDRYLTAQQETSSLKEWASEIVGQANVESAEKRTLAYSRWSRKMEELRYAFSECAAAINRAGGGIVIQFQAFDMISQATWENIRTGASRPPAPFFRLVCRRISDSLIYGFDFARHIWTNEELPADAEVPRVGLFVSREATDFDDFQENAEGPRRPLNAIEYFESDQQLIRHRLEPLDDLKDEISTHDFPVDTDDETYGNWPHIYDRDVSPVTAAQEFIREVLVNRMP